MRPDKKDLVFTWRQNNPQGKKAQCIKELGLTRPTADKYWDDCGLDKKKGPQDQVQVWRLDNPKGSKAQCIKQTGLAKMTVYKYWEKVVQVKKEQGSDQLFFDF